MVSVGTVADFFGLCCPSYLFFLGSNRWTDFYALWLKHVSARKWSYWGLERWVAIFGENIPPKLQKMGANRQFQAKTAKYQNRNIWETINSSQNGQISKSQYLGNYKSDQDQI